MTEPALMVMTMQAFAARNDVCGPLICTDSVPK